MESGNYDENKIREAKEKLACHIEPPGQKKDHGGQDKAPDAPGGSSGGRTGFIDANGRVLLTQMTSAGG